MRYKNVTNTQSKYRHRHSFVDGIDNVIRIFKKTNIEQNSTISVELKSDYVDNTVKTQSGHDNVIRIFKQNQH